jgi:hypothetical protein
MSTNLRAGAWTASAPASSPGANFVIDGGMTRKMIYEK